MSFKVFNLEVRIHFLFTVILSLLLCIDKSGVALSSLLSVAIHEMGHVLIMLLIGQRLRSIDLFANGVHIESNYTFSKVKRILIAIGGPAANLIPIIFIKDINFKTAMMVNGLFNLIPISGTDGGDIIDVALESLNAFPWSKTIRTVFDIALVSICAMMGFIMISEFKNPTLLLSSIYLAIIIISSNKQ